MVVIYGTTGPDKKIGTSGDDLIHGWAKGGVYTSPSGNDTLIGAAGNDSLYGGTGNDSLIGGAGNDLMDGNAGADIFNGGTGDDIYVIDSTADKVTEAAASGTDTIRSYVNYTLGANLENLTLLGTSAINGTGNSLNNTINGNAANNSLFGGDGNDFLSLYYGGNDTLNGGAGNDTLDASYTKENNNLRGDAGNDYLSARYSTGNNNLNGGSGDDNFDASFSYGNNTLSGDAGNDYVSSGFSYGNNTLSGGEGNDFVYTYFSYGNNTLSGGTGNDYLSGGGSSDTLIGGIGNDSFTYITIKPFDTSDVGLDTIDDFHKVAGDTDKITLGRQTFTAINSGAIFSEFTEFAVVTNDAAAAASEAYIVYNQSTGNLFYNQNGALDGLGTGAIFANLTNNPFLTATDFVIQG